MQCNDFPTYLLFTLLFCDQMNISHAQQFIQSRNCKATESVQKEDGHNFFYDYQ